MNDITKALLRDLQDDLNRIKLKESNIEVVWALNKLVHTINATKRLVKESIE